MEAIKDVITYISDEWAVIGSAPVTFITAVVLAGVVIWFFTRLIERGKIAGLKGTINTQNQRIQLFKERLDHAQERSVELEKEAEKTKEAISNDDSAAMRHHSLAASAIASGIRLDLESTAAALVAPTQQRYLSGIVEPVPFEGMGDNKESEKDD